MEYTNITRWYTGAMSFIYIVGYIAITRLRWYTGAMSFIYIVGYIAITRLRMDIFVLVSQYRQYRKTLEDNYYYHQILS